MLFFNISFSSIIVFIFFSYQIFRLKYSFNRKTLVSRVTNNISFFLILDEIFILIFGNTFPIFFVLNYDASLKSMDDFFLSSLNFF